MIPERIIFVGRDITVSSSSATPQWELQISNYKLFSTPTPLMIKALCIYGTLGIDYPASYSRRMELSTMSLWKLQETVLLSTSEIFKTWLLCIA
jgi:hypothetical protein